MTVSRVLSLGKNVSPEMRERVLVSVKALNYRRNENARSIRPGQSTGLIGVAITNISNPYYAELLLGIEEVFAKQGLRILVGNSGEDTARERQLVADFVGRQVDGLILVPSGGDTAHLTPQSLGYIPIVLASRELPGLNVDTVLIDDVTGAYDGTLMLLEEGHKQIAYLGNLVSVFTSQRRFEGYRRALADFGLKPVPELIKMGQQDIASAQRAMDGLLALPQPPTAVFCANSRNTIGVLRAIYANRSEGAEAESGQPPASIRVVGFDNFDLADMMPFPLTVIDHDARELGRQAATLLLSRLSNANEQIRPRTVQLPTRLAVES